MGKFGSFLLVVIGFTLIAGFYVVQNRTKGAAKELARLERTLEQESAAISVLKAEIAHLESPHRLAKLAQEHLDLRPTTPEQVMTLDEAVSRIPVRYEVLQKAQAQTNGVGQ